MIINQTPAIVWDLPPEKKGVAEDIQDQITAGCFSVFVGSSIVVGVVLTIVTEIAFRMLQK